MKRKKRLEDTVRKLRWALMRVVGHVRCGYTLDVTECRQVLDNALRYAESVLDEAEWIDE